MLILSMHELRRLCVFAVEICSRIILLRRFESSRKAAVSFGKPAVILTNAALGSDIRGFFVSAAEVNSYGNR